MKKIDTKILDYFFFSIFGCYPNKQCVNFILLYFSYYWEWGNNWVKVRKNRQTSENWIWCTIQGYGVYKFLMTQIYLMTNNHTLNSFLFYRYFRTLFRKQQNKVHPGKVWMIVTKSNQRNLINKKLYIL